MFFKNKFLALTVAAAMATGGLYAAGEGKGERRARGGEHRAAMLANHLDLTEAQKETAKTLFSQAREASKPIADQLKQNHDRMAEAVKAGREAEIDAIASAQAQLTSQLTAIHAKAMSKFYAQLTPAQKEQADKLHENFKGMMGHPFGR